MKRALDLSGTFIHLENGGDAHPVELTPSFWRDSSASAYDRLVGVFAFASPADLHSTMQEMHPEADEVIVLLEGAIDVVLEEDGSEHTVALAEGQSAIVPRGVWHRLVMREPGRLLFINSRTGMQSRKA